MLVYWLLFVIAAFGVPVPQRRYWRLRGLVWAGVGTVFAVFVGLRYQVGCDWPHYFESFNTVASLSFLGALPLVTRPITG